MLWWGRPSRPSFYKPSWHHRMHLYQTNQLIQRKATEWRTARATVPVMARMPRGVGTLQAADMKSRLAELTAFPSVLIRTVHTLHFCCISLIYHYGRHSGLVDGTVASRIQGQGFESLLAVWRSGVSMISLCLVCFLRIQFHQCSQIPKWLGVCVLVPCNGWHHIQLVLCLVLYHGFPGKDRRLYKKSIDGGRMHLGKVQYVDN